MRITHPVRQAVRGLFLCLLLSFPGGARWQEDIRARLKADPNLVIIPVAVKDAAGNLVTDVRREEFRVIENGVEQEISLFSADSLPLSAVVLIDNALAPRTAEQVQLSAGAIAAGFGEFDEVAVGQFEAFYSTLLDFTSDNDKIHDRLKRLDLAVRYTGQGSGPMTSGPRINSAPLSTGVPKTPGVDRRVKNINDALHAAAGLLESRGRDRRKIILLVSDGANAPNNTVTYDSALRRLLLAGVAVFAVGVGGGGPLGRTGGILSRYARATGGDTFSADSLAELEAAYARVTEQARTQYTLAYLPRTSESKSPYRDIDVRVRRSGLSVLARQGYFISVAP